MSFTPPTRTAPPTAPKKAPKATTPTTSAVGSTRERVDNTPRCYKCSGLGHYARDCLNLKTLAFVPDDAGLIYDTDAEPELDEPAVKCFPERSHTVDQVCTFPHPSFQMAKSVAKYSIMTQEMVDSFCEAFYIPAGVHPTAPGRDKTIIQFPAGKVGVYTRIFDYCGYRIPFTKFFMAVLKYFRIHISQLSPFGAARVSHFEVLTRVLNLAPSVTVFRAFYTRSYSDGLFSFAKRSTTAPSCFTKPPDSIKSWTDHFFWVDSCAFPISVPLYTGGILEKDSAPLLTARQEETVRLLESHKAPFRRYPECFLCQVGLSKYYPFDDNSYPAYEYSNGSDMGLLDFIQTADPRKVRAVEVQKGADQVMLLKSTKDCFMPLVIPAVGGSSSAAAAEVPVPTEERQEDVAPEDAYLNLAYPDEDAIAVRQGDERVVSEHPKKVKKRRLVKQSDALPAKKLRMDHPSLAFDTSGKTLAKGKGFVDLSAQGSFQILTTTDSSGTLSAPVDTAAATTSTRPATASKAAADVGPSHPEESESSDDSFYEIPNVDPAMAKRWYVPKWNITNDSLLDDAFSCRTLVDRVAPPAFFS
ncbi:gypsy type transposase, partial [Tanacetum coccineum]